MKVQAVIFSLFFAYWCWREIPLFAKRINRQVFEDFQALSHFPLAYDRFEVNSTLQPKHTAWAYGFFLLFPLSVYGANSIFLSVILMTLLFLSLLDYCYYLTDSRYLALIFLCALCDAFDSAHIETLIGTSLFFCIISLFSQIMLKKSGLGLGDSLLFVALSPLFSLTEMGYLILLSSLSGVLFSLIFWLAKKKKLTKLPFIPFITFSTYCLIFARILAEF